MTDHEEKERRASIQAIMRDPNLTPHERRKSIQSLMDGRRRSSAAPPQNGERPSMGMGMAAAAAMAAAEFVDSSEDEEDGQEEMLDEVDIDQDIGNNELNGSDSDRKGSKKRSSFSFKRGSSQNIANGKSGKRRSSLRDSFTMGFSKMGVKSSFTAKDGDANALSRKMEKSRPPCGHYERNCSIVSPCCGLVFGCRICHNDSDVLPPPFLMNGGSPLAAMDQCVPAAAGGMHTLADSAPAATSPSKPPAFTHRSASLPVNFSEDESHHEIDRFLIKEIICRECFTRQSSKTNNCINCGIQFGTYHCSTCNLWMSADEDPYHCLKCGFCRVGGRENFTHCEDCGMCIDALLFEDHNCKSGKYMSNCPVCQEDLFSSRMASHEMPCGHAIHWHCFRELTSHDTRCPVCKKTAETHDQMEQTWHAMAMGIALQPVPADMARVVDILCNDCEGKSVNQRWHFLGVQCERCTSFNTTVERTVLVGQEAADFLGPPGDITSQAQWASGGADQNVLTALMGGGAAGLPSASSDEMDTQELNQSVAAEVMGIMNRTNQPYPPLGEGDGDDMDQN
eukprot:CAMPEP_0183729328 /NCGR_PEP_ID=MMETSP0737-20130205/30024_1 /TAXON_ID=385413 /ORGANISM="Thalassiosira miniscula, Strain CCMP1093" /LENGTH=565 /DNA_ID=CAMNT_0025961481 /DNA_START=154 /DNA_END=1851 /DNA_ORIENTATION=+